MASGWRPLLALLGLLLGPARVWCAAQTKRDHYEVLELSREATPADIKRAYKQLAKQYHPDKNKAEDAQQRFIEIQKAYEVLSDPDKRANYDSRAGFWSEEDEDDDEHRTGRRRGPPDGGRGKVLNTERDIRAAVQSDELWLLHIYVDAHEVFGQWMTSLPDEIHLGHVNIGRSDDLYMAVLRMQGGHIDSLPFMVLCQRGRRHAFSLSFSTVFMGFAARVVSREALQFVDYWHKLIPLHSDSQLRDFMLYEPGGSARLRVVFIFEHLHEREFDVFSAVSRLGRYARVAQLGYTDALDVYGDSGDFVSSLKIRRLPAVVFYDPLQNKHATFHGSNSVSGAAAMADRLIDGTEATHKFFPVQELDKEMYPRLCGDGGRNCAWMLILATTTLFEYNKDALANVGSVFSKVCETLSGVRDRLPATFQCVWLRLSHAHSWEELLAQHGPRGSVVSGGYTIAAMSRPDPAGGFSKLVVAEAEDVTSARGIFKWFQNAVTNRLAHVEAEVEWPPLPPEERKPKRKATSQHEESGQDSTDSLDWLNKLFTVMEDWLGKQVAEDCKQVLEDWISKLSPVIEDWRSRAAHYYERVVAEAKVHVEKVQKEHDTETILMFVGIAFIFLILICALTSFLLGGRSEAAEEDVLRALEFWVQVALEKQGDERFGFGIAGDDPHGRLKFGKLAEGGLLEAWNAKLMSPERCVQEGDEIASVTNTDTRRTAVTALPMKRTLMESKGITLLAILKQKVRPGLRKLTSTIILHDLVLADCALFGARADEASDDLEVSQIRPALAAWNDARRSEGASCLSMLELGDRVVSINGHTRVAQHLHVTSPIVLVVKWRLAERLTTERFEVPLERDAKEQWGLKLSIVPGTKDQIEVRQVLTSGMVAKFNAGVASNGGDCHSVLPGDRLVMVNGHEKLEDVARELRATKVVFCFERWLDKKGDCDVDPKSELSVVANGESCKVGFGSDAGAVAAVAVADDTDEVGWGDFDVEFDEPEPEAVKIQAPMADTGNAAVGALGHSAGVDSITEDSQGGWDMDADLDFSMATDEKVDAGGPGNAASNAVVETSADADTQEPKTDGENHQAKQPEDAGWDVDLEFEAPVASDAEVHTASVGTSSSSKPDVQPHCPTSSTTEDALGNLDDGWDFDMDDIVDSTTPPLADKRFEGPPRDEMAVRSEMPSVRAATLAPQTAAGNSDVRQGTDVSGLCRRFNAAPVLQGREKASLPLHAGQSSRDIAAWPAVDAEGCWLRHGGLCVLASATGSQGYVRGLNMLHARFGEPEFPVRFFCEHRLPKGTSLVVLPSRARCQLIPPERVSVAGSLLWRVLGGEVQALVDSFDTHDFGACLDRWHTL